MLTLALYHLWSDDSNLEVDAGLRGSTVYPLALSLTVEHQYPKLLRGDRGLYRSPRSVWNNSDLGVSRSAAFGPGQLSFALQDKVTSFDMSLGSCAVGRGLPSHSR